MADEEDLELEAKDGEGEAKPAKGGKGKLIGIGLAVVLAGGGLAAYLSTGAEPEAEASGEIGEDGAATVNDPDFLTSSGIHRVEPFLVNLADQDKQRFLRAEFQLVLKELRDQEAIEESEVAKATIRHTTINLLSSKTSTEIEGHEARDQLREELRTEIQKALQGIKVSDVLLTDFIIQR